MSDRDWWRHGVIYQIYPRSFADDNGDGVGDLAGITSKLDYLAALGVEAIWLSPFYPSPMADFGYDVADYCGVDELFGTLADFDRMVTEAHARDLRVVIDWVPNHTSDQHPWFLASRSSRADPKRDWYVWRDPGPHGGPPNNWASAFPRVGDAWTFDEATGQYYLHSFMAEQPDLDWGNPQVEAAMHDTLRFWLGRGVDGFRIDVVQKIGKDPELGDNPTDVDESTPADAARRRDEDWWPQVHDRVRGIRSVVEEYPGRMIVGEVYILDQRRLVSYLNSGDQLHLGHNFTFLHLPWKATAFRSAVDEWHALAADEAWPCWFLNNHDHSRVATRYDDDGLGPARARVAAMLTLTLRGTPFIFQGEELGLPDTPIPSDRVVDVDGRDPERAPIPWLPPSVAGPGAGFTDGEPWLPITHHAERLNARRQTGDRGSMLELYRRLIALRGDLPALRAGSYRSLDVGDDDVYAYVREHDGDRVVVALNFGAEPAGLAIEGGDAPLLSTDPDREESGRSELAPCEGIILRIHRDRAGTLHL